MFLTVVLIVLFVLLCSLLFIPIVLYVDTNKNEYYAALQGIAKITAYSHNKEVLQIQLKLFFMKFNFYPFRKKKISKKTTRVTSIKRKRKRRISTKKILRILKSFKVKRFFINIDTGNCITNAKLFPLFALLDYTVGGFAINFNNGNELILHLENRPINIIKSFINI